MTGSANVNAKRTIGWRLTGALLLLGAALVILYLYAPAQYRFYPRCLLHEFTGLNCPGCGGLRATHALLHGDFIAAFHFNPLLFFLAPVGFLYVAGKLWRWRTGQDLPHPFQHPRWHWVLAGLVIGFGVVRNLPFTPFVLLAP